MCISGEHLRLRAVNQLSVMTVKIIALLSYYQHSDKSLIMLIFSRYYVCMVTASDLTMSLNESSPNRWKQQNSSNFLLVEIFHS